MSAPSSRSARAAGPGPQTAELGASGLSFALQQVTEMDPTEPRRPGSTPITRVNGDNVTLLMWIERESQPCEWLVVRSTRDGELLASISDGLEGRNNHAHCSRSGQSDCLVRRPSDCLRHDAGQDAGFRRDM